MKNIVTFLRKKDYKFLRKLSRGGTGTAVLLLDESIDQRFVCKKYQTYHKEHQVVYYSHFIQEIKLLHLLNHQNIVRVFNYYLFPENTTGYILMEYIEGMAVDEFVRRHPDRINDIFRQMITAFSYLEENNILHRDIRPENVLVQPSGNLKVIDFGFGKKIEFASDFDKSVSLNWRYSVPKDFAEKVYDHRTEVYFVGKMFEELIRDNNTGFLYTELLNGMISTDPASRRQSFSAISRELTQIKSNTISFSEEEKDAYLAFVGELMNLVVKINIQAEYAKDWMVIMQQLSLIHQNAILEYEIPNSYRIIRTLVKGDYHINSRFQMKTDTLFMFISLFNSLSQDKRSILANHVYNRLDSVPRFSFEDELPF